MSTAVKSRNCPPLPSFQLPSVISKKNRVKLLVRRRASHFHVPSGNSRLKTCPGSTPLGQDAQTMVPPEALQDPLARAAGCLLGSWEKRGKELENVLFFIYRILLIRVAETKTNNFLTSGFGCLSLHWNGPHPLSVATQVMAKHLTTDTCGLWLALKWHRRQPWCENIQLCNQNPETKQQLTISIHSLALFESTFR